MLKGGGDKDCTIFFTSHKPNGKETCFPNSLEDGVFIYHKSTLQSNGDPPLSTILTWTPVATETTTIDDQT